MLALVFALLVALPAAPAGRCVLDESNALSAAEYVQLEKLCVDVDRAGDGQLAIVITDDFRGDEKEEFANKLFSSWGVGHKGRNDGLLILVSPRMHKWRIEVGYGLEGRITDAQSASIARERGVPLFRAGRTGEGVLQIATALAGLIHQEAVVNPIQTPKEEGWPWWVFALICLGVVVLISLIAWVIVRAEEKDNEEHDERLRRRAENYRRLDTPTSVAASLRPSYTQGPSRIEPVRPVHVAPVRSITRRDDTPVRSSYSSSSSDSWSSSSSSSSDSGSFGGFDGGSSGGGGSGGDW